MPERGADGIYRTQPVESHSNGTGALPVADDPAEAEAWKNWFTASFANHFEVENEKWCRSVAEATMTLIHQRVAPLEHRVKDLEFQLAAAKGAIDMLRTVGSGGINHRGTYDSGTSYARHDVVMLDGSSFLAVRDQPGDLPGDGWRLMASCGKRGARGTQGPRGAPVKLKWVTFDSSRMAFSIIMSDGSSSLIPLAAFFKSVRIDPEEFAIKFVMSDGTEMAFSVRSLFECYDRQKGGR